MEVIFRDHEEAKNPDSGKASPATIFDSIKNKIADNAAESRRKEQEIRDKRNLSSANVGAIMQNSDEW